jgi:hypothetical protein
LINALKSTRQELPSEPFDLPKGIAVEVVLTGFSATLAALREISPCPASSLSAMKLRQDYRMDEMGIARENILFILFILSDLTRSTTKLETANSRSSPLMIAGLISGD